MGTQMFGATLIYTCRRHQTKHIKKHNFHLITNITMDLSEFADYVYIIQLPDFSEENIISYSEPQFI